VGPVVVAVEASGDRLDGLAWALSALCSARSRPSRSSRCGREGTLKNLRPDPQKGLAFAREASIAVVARLVQPRRKSSGESPPHPAAARRLAGSRWCSGTLPSPTEGIMPKSNTPKLSDTQLIILSSAAQREDGLAVLPETLKGGGVA
jgi:hypothetical protein